jgi:hypothetical protein
MPFMNQIAVLPLLSCKNIAVPVAVVVAHLGDRADQRSVSDRAAAQPRAVRQTAVSPLLVRHSKSVLPSPLKSPAEQLVKVLPDDQPRLSAQRHAVAGEIGGRGCLATHRQPRRFHDSRECPQYFANARYASAKT